MPHFYFPDVHLTFQTFQTESVWSHVIIDA